MTSSLSEFLTGYYLLCVLVVPALFAFRAFCDKGSNAYVGFHAAAWTLFTVAFYIGLWLSSQPGWVGGFAFLMTMIIIVRTWKEPS